MFKNSSHHGPTQLSLETEFEKKVSVSFDTLEKDLDADVKVLVVVEPPCVHPFDDLVRTVSYTHLTLPTICSV